MKSNKNRANTQLSSPKSSHFSDLHAIILYLKNKKMRKEIGEQLTYFNFCCHICTELEEIIKVTTEKNIKAIVIDTYYCVDTSFALLQKLSKTIPLIFISSQADMTSRLNAVKAGGSAYLILPLEFPILLEKIDEVTLSHKKISYRILIIEDPEVKPHKISYHLAQIGMVTQILNDPLQTNAMLIEFQPDLVLIDFHLTTCKAVDLAKVIRQLESFTSIPIVYLCQKEDVAKYGDFIKNEGDNFLIQPVSSSSLLAAIFPSAKRYRALHATSIQDSLTGLLNHTRILEQLDLEIARANRNKTALSFVMIDIDYFKIINDAHGHPVGDNVIKGLARLLKQQLRKIDSIGRYGGEEFAVILPQTHTLSVFPKLEEIRRSFSKLLHASRLPMIEFTATFSAGIAELNEKNSTLEKLVHAADQALYQAKAQGRNQIVIDNTKD